MIQEASFLTRCKCGILYKITSVEDDYQCDICGRLVTIKVNGTLKPEDFDFSSFGST